MGTKFLKEELYLKKDNDLQRCSIKNVFLITLLHRLISPLKHRYLISYPTIPEIIIAFIAHRSFHVFDFLYKFRNILRRIKKGWL